MRALPLLVLVVLILVALAVIFTVRAIRAKRARNNAEIGYFAYQIDQTRNGEDFTLIRIGRYNRKHRTEAAIPLDDPNYSNRVIEEFAKADTKARDWNSTKQALV
jgi:cbb3-type cytochrome oxidase subunit 3